MRGLTASARRAALAVALRSCSASRRRVDAGDAERDVVVRFTDPEIVESSGLVVVGDLFVTTNDSGDTGRVFVVDAGTGGHVGGSPGPGSPMDVEALAPAGRDAVWVGDIGDNAAPATASRCVTVPVGRGIDAGATYELVYPDGARDAETLLAHPLTGRLFVVSKEVFGGTVYAVAGASSRPTSPNRLAAGRPTCPGIVTDGAFFPDGKHVMRAQLQPARSSTPCPSLEPVGSFELPEQEQGEGIAVGAGRGAVASSEGQRAPSAARRTCPRDARAAMAAEPRAVGRARAATPLRRAGRATVRTGRAPRTGRLAVGLSAARHLRGRCFDRCVGASRPPRWPTLHAMPRLRTYLARPARAGPVAGRARASSTSTSTATGCPRTTPSGSGTW